MPWIPEEEIKRAREITAIEYLKKYQPNRLKKSSARNEWELTDHDSFKINESFRVQLGESETREAVCPSDVCTGKCRVF